MRRKQIPLDLLPAWRGFEAVLAEIEPAKAGLADVLPGTRLPGRPLAHALAEFEERLARASGLMVAWKVPELQDDWEACDVGLSRSLSEARRRLAEPPALEGFEAVLGLVESLLDPLEPFAGAEATFRRLRRKPDRAT
jgi:hypothetical protein